MYRRLIILIGLLLCSSVPALAQQPFYSVFGNPEANSKSASGSQSKIVPQLRSVQALVRSRLVTHGVGAEVAGLSAAHVLQVAPDGAIEVYVMLNEASDAELQALAQSGARVLASERTFMKAARASMTPDIMDRVAALSFVKKIKLVDYGVTRTGSVLSEGDALHGAATYRTSSGITGAGVKVGIVSDGATNRATAVASGDLPNGITVNPSLPGSGDEGTAMMEIVHDLAPGAQLFFSSGIPSSLDMLNAILWLMPKVDVICDDLGFFGEPFFQDGDVANCARAAINLGKSYVSSAGNQAREHHQKNHTNLVVNNGATGGANWDLHQFSAGDHSLDVSVPAGSTVRVILQWDDPFGTSSNDFDLYFVHPAETVVFASSTNPQDGVEDDPFEFIALTNTNTVAQPAKIYVRRRVASGAPHTLELFVLGATISEAANIVTANSIFGHAAVNGVISCAAVDQAVGTPWCTPEAFSSQGPSTIRYPSSEDRPTPQFMAADGVRITGAGGFGSGTAGNKRFFGTSAAAPHAAALVALFRSCNSSADAELALVAMQDIATDCDGAGFDFTTGYGKMNAGCPEFKVPSASQWSLIALVFLLLAVGAHVVVTQRKTVEP